MLHRLISYGLVLGLGTVALAVLLFAGRSGTNGDPAPGLGTGPGYVVLDDQATPNGGLTNINEDLSAVCPDTAFVPQAGAPKTAPTLAEPRPNAPVGPLPTPCIHAVAWAASPVAPGFAPATITQEGDK